MNTARYCVALCAFALLPVQAQDTPAGRFRGFMFGDFYYVAANNDPAIEGQNGFWFRRIYFTYDHDLSKAFSMRLRLEISSPGDFTTSSTMKPSTKDAYLKWKILRHQVLIGLSSTPTWNVVESIWGYRSVEKTPMDLQKYASSRDIGIAVKGNLDEKKRIYYHLMLGNGGGTKSETNKGKKVYASVGFKPNESITLEAYSDWEDRVGPKRYTLQGFAAYKTGKMRIGGQFIRQTRTATGQGDQNLEIASAFCAFTISEKTEAFARLDHMFDPAPSGISYIPFNSTAESSNLLVAGVSYTMGQNVYVIPNVEVVMYGKDPQTLQTPKTDVIPRVTIHYKFK